MIAGKQTAEGLDADSLVDLAAHIHGGQLTWDIPAGNWKVMKFTWAAVPVGGRHIVDGSSQDCVDWYIRTVYQPHYDHFKADFGKDIAGFFYDEPETHGDWGTEVAKILAERGIDWKKALVAFKFKLAGEQQIAARYQYLDAFAEAWGRTLYGGLTRWCHEHGVKSQGHFLEHADLYANPDTCAGDMFQLQKYSEHGAIDAVFTQFKPGQRVTYDPATWQTPKLGSSITHAYGKPDDVTMVEIFGARGQDLTYPEMKWWADHMQVSGINFLIPHSFNPRAPHDTDCPPYFYNGGFEPRWPLYRVFADYTSRLSLMLTGGRHVCPVALLFAGQSVHVGKGILPDQISEALQDALYDCDWMPYEVFENDTQLADKNVKLREESYRVLIVPPVEVIPYATLAKAAEFFDRGGVVIGYGFLPEKSATLGKTAADIAGLREAHLGAAKPGTAVCRTSSAGGRSYLLPEAPTPEQLQHVLATDAGVHASLEVTEGRTDHWLHVLHRVKAGRDVFFITNQNHTGEARRFRFRITAEGEPECWDAMRNEITTVAYTRTGKQIELTMTLEPSESLLLVFQPDKRPLPARLEPGHTAAAAPIPIVRDPTPPEPEPAPDPALTATQAPRKLLVGLVSGRQSRDRGPPRPMLLPPQVYSPRRRPRQGSHLHRHRRQPLRALRKWQGRRPQRRQQRRLAPPRPFPGRQSAPAGPQSTGRRRDQRRRRRAKPGRADRRAHGDIRAGRSADRAHRQCLASFTRGRRRLDHASLRRREVGAGQRGRSFRRRALGTPECAAHAQPGQG